MLLSGRFDRFSAVSITLIKSSNWRADMLLLCIHMCLKLSMCHHQVRFVKIPISISITSAFPLLRGLILALEI